MLILGIGLTIALIAAEFLMVWFRRIEQKFLAGVLIASAVVGFVIANVNAITKVRFGQFELVKQELATIKEQQQRQDSTLKVTAENQYLLSRSPKAGASGATAQNLLKSGTAKLLELAFPDSVARSAKVQELDRKLGSPARGVVKPGATGQSDVPPTGD